MLNYWNRGDLEYGYPSFEYGTKFSHSTNCAYFELLNYAGSNGKATHTSTGELDDATIEEWLHKVCYIVDVI